MRHEPVRAAQKIQKTATKIEYIFDAFFPMFSIFFQKNEFETIQSKAPEMFKICDYRHKKNLL